MKTETKVAPTEKATKKKSKKTNPKEKVSTKSLTEVNLKKAAKDEIAVRSTKYIYPEDVNTAQKKKEFRRKARAALKNYERDIKILGKSKDPADEKKLKQTEVEFNKWRKETYSPVEG